MKRNTILFLITFLFFVFFAGFTPKQNKSNVISIPVAWQEKAVQWVPVGVKYAVKNDNRVSFEVSAHNTASDLIIDPVLQWNTFLGGSGSTECFDITIDYSGNSYVTGNSNCTWGSPLNPFKGKRDAFVAKINSNGVLLWNTFLGGSDDDFGRDIVIDGSGNIYITGYSYSNWGSPLNPFAGNIDAFVAKLNSSGVLQWQTFMGGGSEDFAYGIANEGNENIYVTGDSLNTWGLPVNPFMEPNRGCSDAFVAKLNSSGIRQWHTFMGGVNFDWGRDIVTDNDSNIYVTGGSDINWGSPINPHINMNDAFVAKLNSSGVLKWNTFLGGIYSDTGVGITIDGSDNIYVTGNSWYPWGNPVNNFSGLEEAFVAKLSPSGVLQWNTFLGDFGDDMGIDIVTFGSDNIYVTGHSNHNWDNPNPSEIPENVFLVKLNSRGVQQWHTFIGGNSDDFGLGIAVDGSGNINLTGYSYYTWGNPVNSFSGLCDAFVAKISDSTNISINITKPNGGELWPIDSMRNITWTSTGAVGNVKIEYSTNNGSSWSTITSSTDNDGIYSLIVPNTKSSNCLVRISEIDGSPSDTSDSTFSIVDSIPTYKITLDRENLYFGSTGNVSTNSQTFLIGSNSSLSTVPTWSITDNQNWLACNPTNGTGSGLVTVTATPAGLSAGNYTGIITVSDPNATNSPQKISVNLIVYGTNQTSISFGDFATPIDGSTVIGSIAVTGWVLDDIGVENVKIYRTRGKNKVYIGSAVFVEGARPDVEQAYPNYPNNYKAGWGYMLLTNFLPNNGNGTFTLLAIATDMEGNHATLGTKTILVDNANAVKPFGAIDTPTQGGTASSSNFRNWGWVLTPQPNMIPTNGTTIDLWIDGVKLGHPTYNIYRSDVASLFPGYANSNGAAGYFDIDTTVYDNGIYTIQWTAADSGGNTDGIGSRYFTIQNTSSSRSSSEAVKKTFSPGYKDLINIPISYDEPIKFKKGYTDDYWSEELFPDTDGITYIQCKELERIDIQVYQAGMEVEGYMMVGNRMMSLPVGSTLEKIGGRFRWIPGPGFVGTYSLVFVETNKYGEKSRKHILVTIVPKFSRE